MKISTCVREIQRKRDFFVKERGRDAVGEKEEEKKTRKKDRE